jgi:hypothetical protein
MSASDERGLNNGQPGDDPTEMGSAGVDVTAVPRSERTARGIVRFHAVIRLDAPVDDYQPPSSRFTAAMLCDAIGQAASAVTVTTGSTGPVIRLTFGPQTDARAIRHSNDLPGTGQALSGQAVANYIAKYATKSLAVPGLPDKRFRTAFDLTGLRCSRHHKQMITTACQLGSRHATGDPRFRHWAHMLG